MTETGWIVVAAAGIIIVGGIWWSRRAKAAGANATATKAGGDVHQTDTAP
ncbi:hypothetical protein ACFSCW_16595 [Sphingomonas tabacisoli]|uniref:LPXTG cell wall anchor domain-containing protein n=1 Tax=Sphingomonas tabacisoli TaxID=2249466 RepID=A0ABW4I604_9SPHN